MYGHCEYCGEDIVEGDEYLECDNVLYHYDTCAENVAVDLLLRFNVATKGVAEEKDEW